MRRRVAPPSPSLAFLGGSPRLTHAFESRPAYRGAIIDATLSFAASILQTPLTRESRHAPAICMHAMARRRCHTPRRRCGHVPPVPGQLAAVIPRAGAARPSILGCSSPRRAGGRRCSWPAECWRRLRTWPRCRRRCPWPAAHRSHPGGRALQQMGHAGVGTGMHAWGAGPAG